jgi:O-methyltransferase
VSGFVFINLRGLPFGPVAVRAAQRFFDALGFQLIDYRPPCVNIEDVELYKPMFSPWLSPEWKRRLHSEDARSLVPIQARYNLYCLAQNATRRCHGDVAECGVYKGGTAKLLAEIVQDRPLYLFDTFTGMPETDPTKDLHKAGDFADTSLDSVRQYLAAHANVQCVPGLIPHSLTLVKDRRFSFVHIDMDIYTSIRSACEFFYERMQPGGVLLFDDYGYPSCPGARKAVDEFFSDKPETKLVMVTGQCSVQKLK